MFVLAICVGAQTTSTEILGLVTDKTGAAVVGATVAITRVATQQVQRRETNSAGEFSFPLVEIGEYIVRVEHQGFRVRTVSGLKIETQQKARVDFVLEVGSVTETVEVKASAVTLTTESAAIGQVVDNKRVTDLPLNGRNMIQLAVMTPGVQYGSRSGGADGQSGFPIPGSGMSVIANGQREVHQSITLDGVESITPLYNISSFTPSIDAIEEFKVQTGSYSAEFGNSSGARVEVSLKSGTNQLHGTVYEFLRNDALDAENYFLNFERPATVARLKKDRLRRNQYGTFLGGPLIKNRTFWSFNFEKRSEIQEGVATAFWPNQDFRKGDFSALLTPANNPATGRPFRNPIAIYDPLTGTPFPGNIVPQARLHPGAQNVINKYLPLPDFQQADILDFTARRAVPQVIGSRQYFGRLDHNFSGRDKVFGRFAVNSDEWDANVINPNFPEYRVSTAYNVATQWIHTFNATLMNELRFGINNWGDNFINPRTNTDFDLDTLGIGKFRVAGDGNRKFTPLETGIPSMGFTIGDPNGRTDDTYSYQLAENLSWVHGKHTLKTGFSYVYAAMDRLAANLTRGTLSFSANETGYDFASFLTGYPNRSQTGEGYPAVNMRSTRVGAYVTDDWKASARLTVNWGVRYDFLGNPYDLLGQVRTIDLANTYTTPSGQKIPTLQPIPRSDAAKGKLWRQSWGFLQPRLGIAYRPTAKWVVRMGAGQYSSPQHFVQISTANLHPPLSGNQQFDSVTDAAGTVPVVYSGQTYNSQLRRFRPGAPVLTLDNPFAGSTQARAVGVRMFQNDRKDRDVWQWSFDIQRELPGAIVLTVGYVGSKTTHSANGWESFNAAAPSPDTNFAPRRPYTQFYDPATPELGIQTLGRIAPFDASANQHYHGLQTRLEKRYAKGFAVGLSYTYSKANGDGEDGGNESPGWQARDRASSRGRSAFDITHNAVINFLYELPFGKNRKGISGVLLKGWQTNGIVSLRSGFPFSVTVPAADLNTGNDGSPVRPDRLADGRLENPSRRLWFDPTAFQRVTCNIPSRQDLCHYGNAGRNILVSPGQRTLDASGFKNFSLTERFKLQFRAELFNALNTPYFGAPGNLSFVSPTSVVPDGPRMGEIRSLRSAMRIIQFGLKLYY
ncbi:MAG TPA: TonB-dependent receptor [Bryobacteraceae bacterium]|nr:TonB-dependent receptor [Bryobacteraceae bacterium]